MMMDDERIEDVDPADLEEVEGFQEEDEEEEEEEEESSDDENVERGVQEDMDKLQRDFPGFHDKYRLIKRIGEGLSCVSNCPCWPKININQQARSQQSSRQKTFDMITTITAGIMRTILSSGHRRL